MRKKIEKAIQAAVDRRIFQATYSLTTTSLIVNGVNQRG